jgi:flagellar basal-body rod protein FlgF
MDRLLYTAMTGARQTMLAQAQNSNNLANASTAGFRAELSAFADAPIYGPGYPTRVFSDLTLGATDLSVGPIQTTGRELDVALSDGGWLAVMAPDGSEAYTRAGDLRIDSGGVLVTGAGHPVLGAGGPIAIPPAEKIEIAADGGINILPPGDDIKPVPLDRLRLVRPDPSRLEKGFDGLMRVNDGGPVATDDSVRATVGALEGSNVNAVEALVDMIALARRYEAQVRMMRSAEETDAALTQVMGAS